MSRIIWSAQEVELGLDRGVLYLGDKVVPWNGLISATETQEGANTNLYFIDGVPYVLHQGDSEFSASLEAYTYPEEIAEYTGYFNLSYRTKFDDGSYRIHLVYNAVAKPVAMRYDSLSESILAQNFTWSIFTKPVIVPGYKPISHLVIDSRVTPSDLMFWVENYLYGTDNTDPSFLPAPELIFVFKDFQRNRLDAGYIGFEYFNVVDAGRINQTQTETIDGGGP